MPRVMLGLRVLGVKGLVWLRQMRNSIDEVLDSIQDVVSTQLKRTNTATCCTTETKLWKEPPLNNSFLQGAGFARYVCPRNSHTQDLNTVSVTETDDLPLLQHPQLCHLSQPGQISCSLTKPLNHQGQSK